MCFQWCLTMIVIVSWRKIKIKTKFFRFQGMKNIYLQKGPRFQPFSSSVQPLHPSSFQKSWSALKIFLKIPSHFLKKTKGYGKETVILRSSKQGFGRQCSQGPLRRSYEVLVYDFVNFCWIFKRVVCISDTHNQQHELKVPYGKETFFWKNRKKKRKDNFYFLRILQWLWG